MRVETFAASLPQQGRSQNEDAFLMGRGERPFAALCDGAGNAERAAKRAGLRFPLLRSVSQSLRPNPIGSTRCSSRPQLGTDAANSISFSSG